MAMNLASIGGLKIAWYEERKSATSNVRYSVRKFSSVPKVVTKDKHHARYKI
jgi:hypothetical protein